MLRLFQGINETKYKPIILLFSSAAAYGVHGNGIIIFNIHVMRHSLFYLLAVLSFTSCEKKQDELISGDFLNFFFKNKNLYEYYYRIAWMDAKYSKLYPTSVNLLYYSTYDNNNEFFGLIVYYNIMDAKNNIVSEINIRLDKKTGITENGKYIGLNNGLPGTDHNNDIKAYGNQYLPYDTEVEYIDYEYDFMFNKHRVNYYAVLPEAEGQVSPYLTALRLHEITFAQMDSLLDKWGKPRLDKVEQWDSIRKSVWGK